jgi:hypothetical protein
MRTKRTKGYIDSTAKEHGLKSAQVLEITESMFRFTAQIMTEGNRKLLDFGEVRLMRWGVFKVREGRRKHFERINNGKRNKTTGGGNK